MSLIARGYVSDSEEEEGEIEHGRVKNMEKKVKLQKPAKAMEDASDRYFTTLVSQAADYSVQDGGAALPADIQSSDSRSQHRTEKSESRSSDDRKSHRKKESSQDKRDRDRHESVRSSKERSRLEAKHRESNASRQDRNKDERRSGDEKVANSQVDIDLSHEHETAKELSERVVSEQRVSSKDGKVDGHRRHSSRSRETSRRHESDKQSESEKRHSARRRSHSSPRQPSPDGRHRSSHLTDKKAER